MSLKPSSHTVNANQQHSRQFKLQSLLPASAYSALVINLDATAHNYRVLQAAAGKAECSAVLKADGYGLGAVAIALRLYQEGCRKFFVAYVDEGVTLRQAFIKRGWDSEIYVLNGFLPGCEATFFEYNLIPTLTALEQLQRWRDLAKVQHNNRGIALHLDTGMSRTGMSAKEVMTLVHTPEMLKGITIKLILSQLSYSYDENPTFSAQQRQRFEQALTLLPKAPASLAKSGAIFLSKDYHYDLVRPGIGLHGINPLNDATNPLKPVAGVWVRVYQVQDIVAGQSVGYAQTFIAATPRRIATLTLGYADGYPWNMGNKGHVSFGKHKAQIVGRISMDVITVDVTDIPESLVYPGAWAEVVGESLTIQQIAAMIGTSPYEVQMNLGNRFQRVYLEDTPVNGL